MRIALKIAYKGTHYLGSQIQKESANTILGTLQNVLKHLGITDKLTASGRTDKGVHALGQVCHLDLPPFWKDIVKLQTAMNNMLPSSIYINKISLVNSTFHARYGAKKRIYRYIIKTSRTTPFESDCISFIQNINFETMQTNIALFVGEHNFKFFMKTGSEVSHTQRIIFKAFAYKYKNFIVLHFEGNGFLRSQIRMMVGALTMLNKQEITDKLKCQINHKVKPAPSNGLYLAKIKY